MTDPIHSTKIQPWHLERYLIIYIRQSDPQQVVKHPESTARQYALVERALALGWPRERILIIDEDQGKSGATAEGRFGFHYVLAEVALDHVGLILGLEVSRPARCCKDWYQLLELCARFHTLLADTDGVYDPTNYNDRLLLGLKGMMSEAELHILKERMYQAKLNKARRGELFHLPPIGYIKLPQGEFAIDPDEQVQAVVRLVFDQFDHQGTVHGLLRYLVHHQIQIPVRARGGANQGQLEWHRPNRPTLLNLLHHPIYAGAYRYGHRAIDPRKQQPGRRHTGKQYLPAAECLVLIRDHLPAYISWERFEANQRRLEANRTNQAAAGAPRQGAALLGGLLYCGRCGRRMQIRYSGRKNLPWYGCTRNTSDYGDPLCQSLSGPSLDHLVTAQILAAMAPAALEADLAAVADVERERAELLRHWNLRIERARYEVGRAQRQYQACEPENRLVARELERRWEEALRQQRQLEEEFARWERSTPRRLSAQDQEVIRALAADLPALWQAETTTPQDRQRIARLLLERVTVTVDKASERVDVQLSWLGGLVTAHTIHRPVSRYDQQTAYPRLVQRLKELSRTRFSSSEIAEHLNAEGFRPPKRTDHFTSAMVLRLTNQLGLTRRPRPGSAVGLGPDEYRPAGLARKLSVQRDTIRRWMRVGWVNLRKDEAGHHILWADADELRRLRRLRQLHQLPRTWANKARLAELKKPKQRPAR
jgi:DNA invertase Pin-like site-specific DNA recombinase